MSNKYILRLEKSGSLLAGAAAGHILQNIATKRALSSPAAGKYISRGFNEGVAGVVDKSFSGRAISAAGSAIVPDVEAMHTGMHSLGQKLSPDLARLSLKQKAVARRLVNTGKISPRYSADPQIQDLYHKARDLSKQHLGFTPPNLAELSKNQGKISEIWKGKDHPVLSNIISRTGRGHVNGPKFKPGAPSAKLGLAASAAAGVLDPAVGALDATKAVMGSKAFNANKYGKKITNWIETQVVKKPAVEGFKAPDKVLTRGVASNLARDVFVNPTANSLTRTSAALSKASPEIQQEVKRVSSSKGVVRLMKDKLKNALDKVRSTVSGKTADHL